MIDTHAHLTRPGVYEHADELINEARREGLLGIINVTMSLEEARNALNLVSKYRGFVYTALGYDYGGFDIREVQSIMKIINDNKDIIVGIGEVGLDYSKVRDPMLREISRHIFTRWVLLAKELDLPIIIHSRDAENDVIELLRKYGPVRCIMHAFGGNKSQVMKLLELGCYFSIPPTITRSRQKRDLALFVPLNRLLVESDTPELGPNPGEPSKPTHIKLVLSELSRVLNVDIRELSDTITRNTYQAFPKLLSK
ncbi:MAG: TatD family hydrolase [Vulcanisaeta sp.]